VGVEDFPDLVDLIAFGVLLTQWGPCGQEYGRDDSQSISCIPKAKKVHATAGMITLNRNKFPARRHHKNCISQDW
jgi:hypothetical protein